MFSLCWGKQQWFGILEVSDANIFEPVPFTFVYVSPFLVFELWKKKGGGKRSLKLISKTD